MPPPISATTGKRLQLNDAATAGLIEALKSRIAWWGVAALIVNPFLSCSRENDAC
jgi:hypothetical protein